MILKARMTLVASLLLPASLCAQDQIKTLKLEYVVNRDEKLADGTVSRTVTKEFVWIAPDGRKRTEVYNSDLSLNRIQLYHPEEFGNYFLNPREKTAMRVWTGPLPKELADLRLRRLLERPQTFLGTGSIAGLKCTGSRTSSQMSVRADMWSCFDRTTQRTIQGSYEQVQANGNHFLRQLSAVSQDVFVNSDFFEVPEGYEVDWRGRLRYLPIH